MRTWYPALKLNGEAGEVAEKVGKAFRDNDGIFDMQRRQDIAKEIGDVLWYCAAVARDLGLSLGDCAIGNFTKLIDRADRDVLGGSGDNR
ncbi:MAG: nucleoside triphosphate pyrophosphohydrolase family protein [Methylobacteriaceae bacterium]|nr:nucleoside triphosphate pyrophosphohydrolase family protein [Methylobacteriaceae bacterium]